MSGKGFVHKFLSNEIRILTIIGDILINLSNISVFFSLERSNSKYNKMKVLVIAFILTALHEDAICGMLRNRAERESLRAITLKDRETG